MMAVAHTDLPNGIIIVLACCLALPFVVVAAADGPPSPTPAAQPLRRVLRGLREVPGPEGFRLLPLDPAAPDGRPVDVPEVLFGQVAARRQAGRGDLDRGTIVVETVVIAIAVFASAYNVQHATNWEPRTMVLNAAATWSRRRWASCCSPRPARS